MADLFLALFFFLHRLRHMVASSLRLAGVCPPLGRAEACQGLELAVAELDVGGADHARLEAHDAADLAVQLGRGVVAHHKVVPVVVLHLVHRHGLGQGEDAPVGEAADDAAVA